MYVCLSHSVSLSLSVSFFALVSLSVCVSLFLSLQSKTNKVSGQWNFIAFGYSDFIYLDHLEKEIDPREATAVVTARRRSDHEEAEEEEEEEEEEEALRWRTQLRIAPRACRVSYRFHGTKTRTKKMEEEEE